jgi:2-polyprenyl-6-hydroxyphenyl methylase/3-demethylubiquinone-9 3-methyltransferase
MGLDITYHHKTAEDMLKGKKRFDIVLAMEIVEHVDDVSFFITSISQLVRKDGLLFMSTLNRTAKSYLFGIIGAEYVLRWLAKGTHSWHKFLKPSELIAEIQGNGLKVQNLMGITYSPLSDRFLLNPKDLSINYMLYAKKENEPST